MGSSATGAPNRGGVGAVGDFWPISCYMSEMVQDRDIVTYGRLIGTCMHSIEWCYFQ